MATRSKLSRVSPELEELRHRMRHSASHIMADAVLDDGCGRRRKRHAVEQHVALARNQSGKRLEQRGLARAIRTDDDRKPAGRSLEVDAMQYRDRAIAGAQSANDERAHASVPR